MKFYESIILDRKSSEPMYIQVYEGIKKLIENEALKGEERLPAIRNLAQRLGVNNVTIVNAYKMLEQRGYISSRVGSGTFVRGKMGQNRGSQEESSIFIQQGSAKPRESEINFSTSTPSPELFPVEEFKGLLNEVLDRDGGFAFGYQESQGYYPLREAISKYFEVKGIEFKPSNIQVISGAQQGIDIAAKALIDFNDTIIVESPTYTGAIAAFRSRGANIVEVPISEDGIDTREVEEILKSTRVKLIYIMTSFQNPTGISYSQDKKLQLLYLAQKYNVYILEDDYLSELRYYEEESMPIKALDGGDRVMYLKSFSKIFMPGIRLGFLGMPEGISRRVISAKHNSDISTSSLMQRVFELYLCNGKWQKHMDMMIGIYKSRFDALINALEENSSIISYIKPEGGLHIWAGTDIDASILSSLAKQRGVLMAPGKVFYPDDRDSNWFRLSIAGVDEEKIREGIKIITEVYQDYKNMNCKNIISFL